MELRFITFPLYVHDVVVKTRLLMGRQYELKKEKTGDPYGRTDQKDRAKKKST